jgi:hypothetical protein
MLLNSITELELILESKTDGEPGLISEYELGAVVGVEGDCGWVVEFDFKRDLELFRGVGISNVRAFTCMYVCTCMCMYVFLCGYVFICVGVSVCVCDNVVVSVIRCVCLA